MLRARMKTTVASCKGLRLLFHVPVIKLDPRQTKQITTRHAKGIVMIFLLFLFLASDAMIIKDVKKAHVLKY